MPTDHSYEPGDAGGSENPASGHAPELSSRPGTGKTQSNSHFPRTFPGPLPPNSRAMGSPGPRRDEARQSDKLYLEGEASRFRRLRGPGNRPPELRTALRPDGNAFHLEGKLVAHYHADPLGATKLFLLSV